MTRSLLATVKLGALFVLVVAGMVLSGAAGLRTEPRSAEAALLSEVKKLLAFDAEATDRFGISVAVSGDTAVVGAWRADAGGIDSGAAYVFQRSQGGSDNWGQVKKLTASDAQADDRFGQSVTISGDTTVVGAGGEDAVGSSAGAAYVFQRDQGGADNWGEVKKLTASDAQPGDEFGVGGVAVSGDTAIVGAFREDSGGSNAGAAYVFQRDQGGADNWGELKKLTATDAQASDRFGVSVAASAGTVVIGVHREDSGTGAAYVFQRDQGGADNWGEVKKLLSSDAQAGDIFGGSVAVSGDTAVVAAFGQDAGGSEAGAAYVFQRDQGGADNWGEVKKLITSDAQADDEFGRMAISGNTIVVGARLEDAGGTDAGAAYVFQRDQGGADNWGEVKKLVASDAQPGDNFAIGVAISGGTAFVGAWSEDAAGADAGAAYVFQQPQPTPTPTPTPCTPPEKPVPSGCAVGGIALDAKADLRALETSESSSHGFRVAAWAIVAAAGAVTLGSAAWYAKRRQPGQAT